MTKELETDEPEEALNQNEDELDRFDEQTVHDDITVESSPDLLQPLDEPPDDAQSSRPFEEFGLMVTA